MADLLECTLRGELLASVLIHWLAKKRDDVDLPEQLKDSGRLRNEFVPFFLNYLRDQTLPLLQNCKSVTPSPVKTPSSQKLKSGSRKSTPSSEGRQHGSVNRVQLFSPSDRSDLGSFCALDNSRENSPRIPLNPAGCGDRRRENQQDSNSKYKHKFSPRDNRPFAKATADPYKSVHRISLADFLTPSDTPGNKKKKSPLVNTKKDKNREDGQYLSPSTSRQWKSKKRQSFGENRQSAEVPSQDKASKHDPKIFNLTNSDDFPAIGQVKQSEKNPPSAPTVRRINPTPIRDDIKRPQNTAFLEAVTVWGNNKSTGFTSEGLQGQGDAARALDFERALLRKEKAKRQEEKASESSHSTLNPVTPTKSLSILQKANSKTEVVVAERSQVTHEDKLMILAEIYLGCINANLLPNLNVELYFLVQLLTIQEVSIEDDHTLDLDDVNFFSSIHNAVFFAVNVLQGQQRLLSQLDKSTVRLLSDNPRVLHFSPQLASQLNQIHDSGQNKNASVFPKSPIGGVSFQADTDNRENFPSQQSFLLFKKQRDQFYEIIRDWEECHMTPGWQMTEKLGTRIRSLVKSKTELANHIHLSRLFQSQLLTMCRGDQSYKTEGDDEQVALLTHLKKTNPEKFKRLQERFVTPMTIGGPSPPPGFPGYQEFFRDFILAASCHTFNQHLTDTFSAKISELDKIQLTETDVGTEDGGTKTIIDEEEKEGFVTSLLSVRLVAKFMGFLTFLPYQTTERLPGTVLPSYLDIRTKVNLPLDIIEFVKRALNTGRLVMTVPWVVEFLSMMDQLSPLLTYFIELLHLLLQLYRLVVNKPHDDDNNYTYLLLSFTLGWFFELPVIPEGFFFKVYPDLPELPYHTTTTTTARPLDELNLIDQQVLYTCCPYLVEIRSLLLEFAVGTSTRKATIRKITPVAADDTHFTSPSEKQLQLHMEENFFHNQSASLKRVVEFVGERTASNFIKKLRASCLNQAFLLAKEKVGQLVASLAGVSPNSRTKEKLCQDVLKEAGHICEKVRDEVNSTVHQFCHSKISEVLPSLLPEDQMAAVVEMSVSISCRQAEERVNQWVTNHITSRVFHGEMSEELEKMCRPVNLQKTVQPGISLGESVQTQTPDSGIHDEEKTGPTDALTVTKEYVRNLVLYKSVPDLEGVTECIDKVYDTLLYRQDILPEGLRSFSQMLQDLALYLICCNPELWLEEFCSKCISMWTRQLSEYSQFHSVISPRLLIWRIGCKKTGVSWQKLSEFIIRLLESNLLSPTQLSRSVIKVIPLALKMGLFEDVTEVLLPVLDREKHSSHQFEFYNDLIDLLHHQLISAGDSHALRKLEELTNTQEPGIQEELTNTQEPGIQNTNPGTDGLNSGESESENTTVLKNRSDHRTVDLKENSDTSCDIYSACSASRVNNILEKSNDLSDKFVTDITKLDAVDLSSSGFLGKSKILDSNISETRTETYIKSGQLCGNILPLKEICEKSINNLYSGIPVQNNHVADLCNRNESKNVPIDCKNVDITTEIHKKSNHITEQLHIDTSGKVFQSALKKVSTKV